ncbi:4'-phosphopantetheinyl transferase family protein [Ruminiclostridium cellulolyticum]|uniref:4'-phosphopantetheinyl transferase n=1 Tax=Ruminiclostridium cellulolyticum (strain ATCC 35319 / DSM 5812 / JCM 6584 / H10) TaxID=394503 RepID=B8I7C7_RUMCH|nr:4'-phosphopantetheinyl transferase superfamily protein [Ruminiclostridium cellulolyticum]ACL75051.1 4'-phosphopantetheinyl transferase [Ruminiclostridium cellulolyticum H10]
MKGWGFLVNLYGIRVSACTDDDTIELLKKLISDERKAKMERFIFKEDSIRCLLGEVISRYAISKHLNCKNVDISFKADSFSKPYLDNTNGSVFFNISHSGNWVVCVLSSKPSGIDVEFIKQTDFGIAKRFFTREEYETLMNQPADYRSKYFFKLWTLKESYIKADGRGLSLPLDSFSIKIDSDLISLSTQNKLTNCFFRQFEIDAAHIVSVCSEEDSFPNEISYVSVQEILKSLC